MKNGRRQRTGRGSGIVDEMISHIFALKTYELHLFKGPTFQNQYNI